jgi:rhodanese-related sulfurtransferase
MPSSVTEIAPADSAAALAHFESAFRFETDCWDVHDAVSNGRQDFTLVDVRSPDLYANGHALGAVNIPHRKLIESMLSRYPRDTMFVVYCAGPHCNGAHRAAVRLARLGRPVKIMVGGMTGWLDEGFSVASGPVACAALSG